MSGGWNGQALPQTKKACTPRATDGRAAGLASEKKARSVAAAGITPQGRTELEFSGQIGLKPMKHNGLQLSFK